MIDKTEVRRQHREGHIQMGHVCVMCLGAWPCTTIQLLNETELLQRQLDVVDDALDWKFTGEGRITRIKQLQGEVDEESVVANRDWWRNTCKYWHEQADSFQRRMDAAYARLNNRESAPDNWRDVLLVSGALTELYREALQAIADGVVNDHLLLARKTLEKGRDKA